MRRNIDREIKNFINCISDLWTSDREALDGDETEEISNKVLAELDKINGND